MSCLHCGRRGLRDLLAETHARRQSIRAAGRASEQLIRTMSRIQNSHQDFPQALILYSRFVTFEPTYGRSAEVREV